MINGWTIFCYTVTITKNCKTESDKEGEREKVEKANKFSIDGRSVFVHVCCNERICLEKVRNGEIHPIVAMVWFPTWRRFRDFGGNVFFPTWESLLSAACVCVCLYLCFSSALSLSLCGKT